MCENSTSTPKTTPKMPAARPRFLIAAMRPSRTASPPTTSPADQRDERDEQEPAEAEQDRRDVEGAARDRLRDADGAGHADADEHDVADECRGVRGSGRRRRVPCSWDGRLGRHDGGGGRGRGGRGSGRVGRRQVGHDLDFRGYSTAAGVCSRAFSISARTASMSRART